MERQWWRIGGLLGIAFPILFIIGIILPGEDPGLHAPIEEVRAYYTDHGDRYLVGGYLTGLGMVFAFIPFVATLAAVLGRAEGTAGLCTRLTILGGALFVAAGLVSNVGSALAMGAADPDLDAAALRTLLYIDAVTFSMMTLPMALMLLAVSFIIWRRAVVWRWLAVLGLVVAAAGVVSPLMVLDGGDEEGPLAALAFLIAFPGLGLWTLLAGLNLAMRRALPAAVEQQSIAGERRSLPSMS